jgi:hypothetical protein
MAGGVTSVTVGLRRSEGSVGRCGELFIHSLNPQPQQGPPRTRHMMSTLAVNREALR